jgi:hypothetical protein
MMKLAELANPGRIRMEEDKNSTEPKREPKSLSVKKVLEIHEYMVHVLKGISEEFCGLEKETR